MSYSSEVLADSPLAYWRLDDAVLVAATANQSYPGEGPANAFDGNTSTVWTCSTSPTGWVQGQFSSAKVVTSYNIAGRSGVDSRNPSAWTLQGSNDGSTWTTIDTQTGQAPVGNTLYTYSIPGNSTAYSYYRFNITANRGDANNCNLSELQLAGYSPATSTTDSSGNAHAGNIVGLPLSATGLLTGDTDTAYAFPGDGSARVEVPYGAWAAPSSFTIEAIIKPTGVSGTQEIVTRQISGSASWMIRLDANVLKFWFLIGSNYSSVNASTTIVAGNTYHVVGTYDGTTKNVYVNGSLAGSASSAAPNSTTIGIAIGGNTGLTSEGFGGTIDEVAFYGTALSATRISAHYNAATTTSTPASATASLNLSASSTPVASASATASLNLSASAAPGATAAGSASLNLSATAGTATTEAASGTASLNLSATTGTAGVAAGTASLALSASGTAGSSQAVSATAGLNLIATGSAIAAAVASASLNLNATESGTTQVAAGSASLNLSIVANAIALFTTDTSNALDGLDLLLTAAVFMTTPIPPKPSGLPERYDKSIPYPAPVMVGGRPT